MTYEKTSICLLGALADNRELCEMTDRKTITKTYGWDMDRLFGVPLAKAAEYLLQLSKEAPPGAWLEDTTNSYDQMEIEILFHREETDDEYSLRMEQERLQRELEERSRKLEAEKDARRKQWLKLKKEFGGY
jgi:hypothetical protein